VIVAVLVLVVRETEQQRVEVTVVVVGSTEQQRVEVEVTTEVDRTMEVDVVV